MEGDLNVQPLSARRRRSAFFFLLGLFVVILPFLFLYATGYRFQPWSDEALISTGGLYVAADRTGAAIYIDEELVRETRTFRTAFYAQGLAPGTHRVHVQKEDHHTWVKELPVYPHLVTEAQAFNLLLVPEVRVLSPWRDSSGATVLFASSSRDIAIENTVMLRPDVPRSLLIADTEFANILTLFTATSSRPGADEQLNTIFPSASSSVVTATSTKVSDGVMLSRDGDDVYAEWIGPRNEMPYYYCAEDFEIADTTTLEDIVGEERAEEILREERVLIGPVQSVTEDAACEPSIRIDRRGQQVNTFDFYPGSNDFVIMGLEDGVYVVEIDDRAWQNVQPLMLGEGLEVRVENGQVYVYDGELIYNVLI